MRAALVLALLLAPAMHAAAQADVHDARALFEQGSLAVREGRFAEGRELLERSLAIAPRPATAFNLVVALRGIDELVTASTTCADLLAGTWGELDEAHRAEAEGECAAIEAAVAHLEVSLEGDAPGELRLDGVALSRLAPGQSVERALDPGTHALTLTSPGRPLVDRSLDLGRGSRLAVTLSVPPAPAHGDDALVLGLGIGGGVAAAVVIAIVVGVVVSSAPATAGGDFPITMTLSSL